MVHVEDDWDVDAGDRPNIAHGGDAGDGDEDRDDSISQDEETKKLKAERFIDLFEESYLSFLAGLVYSPLPFLTIALFSIFMSSRDIGAFYFIYAAMYIARRPINGIVNTMRKRASEHNTPLSSYFGMALVSSTLYFLIFSVLVIGLVDLIASILFVTTSELSAGVAAFAGITLMIIGTRIQSSIGKPSIGGWLLTIRDLIFVLIVLIGGLILGKTSPEFYLYMYGIISAILGVISILDVNVIPQWPTEYIWRSSWSFMKWEIPNTISADILTEIPAIVLGVFFGGIIVSIFESASQASIFLPALAITIADPLLLRVSNRTSAGEHVHEEIKTAFNVTLAFPLVLLTVLLSIGPDVFRLFFNDNIELIWQASVILAIARLAASSEKVFSRTLRGGDAPEIVTKALVPGVILISILVSIGAFVGGVIGAALAILVSNMALALYLRHQVYRFFEINSLYKPLLLHQFLSFIGSIIIVRVVKFQYGISGTEQIIIAAAGAIFLFTMFLFFLNKPFRDIATDFLIIVYRQVSEAYTRASSK